MFTDRQKQLISAQCTRPVRLVGRNHRVEYVPCGTCPACQLRISRRWRSRCDRLFSTFRPEQMLFVTMTYSNYNLPYLYRTDSNHGYIRRMSDPTMQIPWSVENPYPDEFHGDEWKPKDLTPQNFYKPLAGVDEVALPPIGDVCGILFKDDYTKFAKRLRRYFERACAAEKRSAPKITIFAVGEYGPITFRPHFHALLGIPDASLLPELREAYFKAWKYDVSRSKSCQNVTSSPSSYLSSYVAARSNCPDILRSNDFRQFHRASISKIFSPADERSERLRTNALFSPRAFFDDIYQKLTFTLPDGTRPHAANAVNALNFVLASYPKPRGLHTLCFQELCNLYRNYKETNLCFSKAKEQIESRMFGELVHACGDNPAMAAQELSIVPFNSNDRYSSPSSGVDEHIVISQGLFNYNDYRFYCMVDAYTSRDLYPDFVGVHGIRLSVHVFLKLYQVFWYCYEMFLLKSQYFGYNLIADGFGESFALMYSYLPQVLDSSPLNNCGDHVLLDSSSDFISSDDFGDYTAYILYLLQSKVKMKKFNDVQYLNKIV